MLKKLKTPAAILAGFIGVTFTIYYLNLDMKLVRKVYELLGPHYDSLERKREL